jgi:pimeloyl-ACP methyl ester carboxylesterase
MVLAALGAAALIVASLLAAPVRSPPELKSVTACLVDWSDLPELERFQARDGTELAFRRYQSATIRDERIVVLVHGSAGNSANMHAVGRGLMAAGVRAVALDIRGHGRSGTRGDIGYVGQLEHDLADLIRFLRQSTPDARFTLVGHSAGGGFALRVAGGVMGELFERYVLVAPYLGPFAPTSRPQSANARWAEPNIPRIIALATLNGRYFLLRVPTGTALRCPRTPPTRHYSLQLSADVEFRIALGFSAICMRPVGLSCWSRVVPTS